MLMHLLCVQTVLPSASSQVINNGSSQPILLPTSTPIKAKTRAVSSDMPVQEQRIPVVKAKGKKKQEKQKCWNIDKKQQQKKTSL